MSRTVRSFLPVTGDPPALRHAFVGDPTRWLPDARRVGPEAWTLTVRAGHLTRRVEAQLGAPWRAGGGHWRTLSWEPLDEAGDGVPIDRLLPSMEAELGLHVLEGTVTLVLDGHYQPPGGALGAALDSVALQRVARATVDRLLADVAARLAAEAASPSEVAIPEDDDVAGEGGTVDLRGEAAGGAGIRPAGPPS